MRPVIAYHLILTFYGFWLPNDPRGSWSDFVRAFELRRFGPTTKVRDKRSRAHDSHDRAIRREAKKHLARSPVKLTGIQAHAVARGFHEFVDRSGITIYACAVMPDHCHLVIKRHRYSIEEIARKLKGDTTRQLSLEHLHPFADDAYRDGTLPSPCARGEWSCFLDSDEYIKNAITYTNNNPMRDRMKRQSWRFVIPFEPVNA